MSFECFDLSFKEFGGVYEVIRDGGAHDPRFADRPGLEALFFKQLGKGKWISRVGINRLDRSFSGGHVVGVAGAYAIPIALWRLNDHAVRARNANRAHNRFT